MSPDQELNENTINGTYLGTQTPIERLRNKLTPFITMVELLDNKEAVLSPFIEHTRNDAYKNEIFERLLKTCIEYKEDIKTHLSDCENFYSNQENKFKVVVLKDDEIEAFGAYASTTVKKGEAIVLLNIEANLGVAIEHEISFKELLIETLMHEVGHALEEWYDLDFDEDRIDRITESYRQKYLGSEK
jgi:hypothetical protein